MSGELWVVRAGVGAQYAAEFEQNSYIAINFAVLASDDLGALDEAAVRGRAHTPQQRAYASMLVAFAYRMQPGDLVIVSRVTTSHRDYLVGEVAGPYTYVAAAPASGHHRRRVRWLGTFARDGLTSVAMRALDASGTVFRPTSAEAEVRAVLTALAPVALADGSARIHTMAVTSVPAVGIAPPERVLPSAQFDVDVDPTGRALITSRHPAVVMEQTPRHVNPSDTWRGVPGIYVLTGTDLEHSATRTGNERTLTATMIVRPWAYVGLSEDFFGRIGSHRQEKPEWRRALLVRSGAQPFSSDDIKYLELRVHSLLADTSEVKLTQSKPRGNVSAHPRNPTMLDACADTVVAVLRLTGTLI